MDRPTTPAEHSQAVVLARKRLRTERLAASDTKLQCIRAGIQNTIEKLHQTLSSASAKGAPLTEYSLSPGELRNVQEAAELIVRKSNTMTSALGEEIEVKVQQVEYLIEEWQDIETELRALSSTVETRQQAVRELMEKIDGLKHRLNMLEPLQKSQTGADADAYGDRRRAAVEEKRKKAANDRARGWEKVERLEQQLEVTRINSMHGIRDGDGESDVEGAARSLSENVNMIDPASIILETLEEGFRDVYEACLRTVMAGATREEELPQWPQQVLQRFEVIGDMLRNLFREAVVAARNWEQARHARKIHTPIKEFDRCLEDQIDRLMHEPAFVFQQERAIMESLTQLPTSAFDECLDFLLAQTYACIVSAKMHSLMAQERVRERAELNDHLDGLSRKKVRPPPRRLLRQSRNLVQIADSHAEETFRLKHIALALRTVASKFAWAHPFKSAWRFIRRTIFRRA